MRLCLLIAALTGLVCLPLFVNGPQISEDSLTYVAVAQNLVNGNGFVAGDGHRITEFAPLYPLTLSALLLTGMSPAVATAAVNIAALIALLSTLYWWASFRFDDERIRTGVIVATAAIYPVGFAWQWAWGEPMFVVFTTAALAAADRFFHNNSKRALIVAIFCMSGALTTRYAGALVVVTVLIALFYRRQWLYGLVGALVSAIPITIWIVSNAMTSSAAGERGENQVNVAEAITGVTKIIGKWAVGPLPTVLLVLVGIALLAVCAVQLKRRRDSVAALFVLIYAVGIVIIGAATGISAPNDRLILPLVPALVMIVATALAKLPRLSQQIAAAWLVFALILGVGFSAQRSINDHRSTGEVANNFSIKN